MQTAAVEKQCQKHGAYTAKVITIFNSKKETSCQLCEKEREEEKQCEKEREKKVARKRLIAKRLGDSGVPLRFKNREFDNYRCNSKSQSQALEVSRYFAENFSDCLKNGASLLFCGNPGTGKTHLATAISNHVCRSGYVSLFISVLKAVRSVKSTWNRNENGNEQEAYNALIEPDLLILDEVGVQFGSDAEKLILFEILNGRYENMKSTIVISNLSIHAIAGYLGERVIDRLGEGGGSSLIFDWDSYRTKVAYDEALNVA